MFVWWLIYSRLLVSGKCLVTMNQIFLFKSMHPTYYVVWWSESYRWIVNVCIKLYKCLLHCIRREMQNTKIHSLNLHFPCETRKEPTSWCCPLNTNVVFAPSMYVPIRGSQFWWRPWTPCATNLTSKRHQQAFGKSSKTAAAVFFPLCDRCEKLASPRRLPTCTYYVIIEMVRLVGPIFDSRILGDN